jgi:hypothetical protein
MHQKGGDIGKDLLSFFEHFGHLVSTAFISLTVVMGIKRVLLI